MRHQMRSFLKALTLVLALVACVAVSSGCFWLMNQPSTFLLCAGFVGLGLFLWLLFKGGRLWLRW